jgi:hypothetical protein
MKFLGINFNVRYLLISFLSGGLIGLMQFDNISQINVRVICALGNLLIFFIAVNKIDKND